jgi:UDP-N-acetyl-D-mannosaminuronate dehydrogenase
VLGAAYKGGVDDTRESPAKYVVQKLLEKGADVVVYDPYTPETFGARPAKTLEEAAKDADALVIVTDHPEFKKLDLVTLVALMRHRIIIDGRRAVEPHAAAAHGFTYYAVGYGKAYKL